jgi:gliding motility-associated-like protein
MHFTPNGDGVNDTWNIKYLETYPGNTVDIYNRQGEKVYSSIGYASPWDGRYKGAILPTGTYYYIINPKNGRKLISGNVTIIK